MGIEVSAYNSNSRGLKKPLMIGCSGGGGHIAAIHGVNHFLKKQFGYQIQFTDYSPVLHAEKKSTWTKTQIDIGTALMHDIYGLSSAIKKILGFTRLPILPDAKSLALEIEALNSKESARKKRQYIDMLLDVYPIGYESAAIWNVLQRNDSTSELKKLIGAQCQNDGNNYVDVRTFFLDKLNTASNNNEPYTEIISTQAMGLSALCDAVIHYNAELKKNNDQKTPKIVIHQYMTDLPSKGAVHYFNVLSTLTPKQQLQIKLYGVGLQAEVLNHFFPKGHQFKGVYNIPSEQNPMVRPAFIDETLDNSKQFHTDLTITLAEKETYQIAPNEQIGSIILGSQASLDTVEYIETLLDNGMNKVFVFGGKHDAISKQIDAILSKNPNYKNRIIRLGYQGDKEMMTLLTRSNMVITRGGGLSVMEQMTMPHNKLQTVLIHHTNSASENLTSGISWEDDNTDFLIANLKQKNVHAEKTTPERAKRHIAEARLISAVKQADEAIDTVKITQYITKLSLQQLEQYVSALNEPESKTPLVLQNYINECDKAIKDAENRANSIIQNLIPQFEVCKSRLDKSTESYQAVIKFLTILNDKTISTSIEKLSKFKNEYDKPDNALLSNTDNFILRILKEVQYQLSKVFIFKYMPLEKFFSPEQKIRKQMEELNVTRQEAP